MFESETGELIRVFIIAFDIFFVQNFCRTARNLEKKMKISDMTSAVVFSSVFVNL